jgi:hypothetical protein
MKTVKILFIITLLFSISHGNDEDFKPIRQNEIIKYLQGKEIKISVFARYRSIIHNELIKDSSYVNYNISIDSIQSKYFWDSLCNKYVDSFYKLVPNAVYLFPNCGPNQAIFIDFGNNGSFAHTYISDCNLKDGYFVLLSENHTYKFKLSNQGITVLRNILQNILTSFPKEMICSCCNK